MTSLAIGYKSGANGREVKTDGLHRHLGLEDASTLRVYGTGGYPPKSGAGIEQLYGAQVGYIQSFDRDANAYTDLVIAGRNVTLQPNSPGSLVLPAGSIPTSALAAGAAQAQIANYVGVPTFSSAVMNTWLATPVTCSGTPALSGALLRIEVTVTVAHTAANGQWQIALGWDGAVAVGLAYVAATAANMPATTSFVYYATGFSVAPHSWTVYLSNAVAGTVSLYSGTYSVLYVTEQRR